MFQIIGHNLFIPLESSFSASFVRMKLKYFCPFCEYKKANSNHPRLAQKVIGLNSLVLLSPCGPHEPGTVLHKLGSRIRENLTFNFSQGFCKSTRTENSTWHSEAVQYVLTTVNLAIIIIIILISNNYYYHCLLSNNNACYSWNLENIDREGSISLYGYFMYAFFPHFVLIFYNQFQFFSFLTSKMQCELLDLMMFPFLIFKAPQNTIFHNGYTNLHSH